MVIGPTAPGTGEIAGAVSSGGRVDDPPQRLVGIDHFPNLGDAAALRTAPKPEVATNISGALTMSAAFPVSGNPVIPTPHSADLLPPLAHALLPPSSRLAPSSP